MNTSAGHSVVNQTHGTCLINGRRACVISIDGIKRKGFRRLSALGGKYSKGSQQTEKEREEKSGWKRKRQENYLERVIQILTERKGEGCSACSDLHMLPFSI